MLCNVNHASSQHKGAGICKTPSQLCACVDPLCMYCMYIHTCIYVCGYVDGLRSILYLSKGSFVESYHVCLKAD